MLLKWKEEFSRPKLPEYHKEIPPGATVEEVIASQTILWREEFREFAEVWIKAIRNKPPPERSRGVRRHFSLSHLLQKF